MLFRSVGTTLLVSGCGGGSSSSSTDDTASGNQTTTVSGRAADGYLAQAQVFVDLNGNGSLDRDEPRTDTDGTGFFSLETPRTNAQLVVEAIQNLTVDLDTNQPVPKPFTLRAPIIPENEEQFVSPITTMVSDELEGGATLEQAKQTVSTRLKTTFDPMEDFLAAKASTDATVAQNAERLHRIAQVTARIAAQVEAETDQSDLDTLGITKSELIGLINTQIEILLPTILSDVDSSLGEEAFDPDTLTEKPEYEVAAPTPDEPNNGGGDSLNNTFTELNARFENAASDSPFFDPVESGGTSVNVEAKINYFDFTALQSGQLYYGALQTSVIFEQSPGAALSNQEFFPLFNSTGDSTVREFISADNSNMFVFDQASGAFKEETIEDNMIGFLNAVPGSLSGSPDGSVLGSAYNDTIQTYAQYISFSLAGLRINEAMALMHPEIRDTVLEQTDQAIFSEGAMAYAKVEGFENDVFLTDWRKSFQECGAGAALADLQGCNTVYGESSNTNGIDVPTPATDFDALAYPAGITDENVNAAVIGFESGGIEHYMTLHGNKADGSGEIRVSKYDRDSFVAQRVGTGTWELKTEPFEHIALNMPDGIYYRAFQDTRGGAGYSYLHELDGYLRAGRYVPADAPVQEFFNRDPNKVWLNELATNEALGKLNEWGYLTQHPGFTNPD